MSDQIARLRALLAKATPGPWGARTWGYGIGLYTLPTDGDSADRFASLRDYPDAAAIAALGTLWPELLAVVVESAPLLGNLDAHTALRAKIAEVLGEP